MFINRKNSASGFTLIEILVAALILAIGILGMATMMLSSLKSDQSAFYRSMASTYAYDMADRIRKNAAWARDNTGYNAISTKGSIPTNPGCQTQANGCPPSSIAEIDIREWTTNFENINGIADAQYKTVLPNSVGTVTRGTDNLFTIRVQWSEVDWDTTNSNQKTDSTETLSLTIVL